MFTNGLNMGLPQGVLVKKTVNGVETQWHSRKEKILGGAVCKEGDADSLMRPEKLITIDFLEKGTL